MFFSSVLAVFQHLQCRFRYSVSNSDRLSAGLHASIQTRSSFSIYNGEIMVAGLGSVPVFPISIPL